MAAQDVAIPKLLAGLQERGYQGRVVSSERLQELRADIEGHRQAGRLDQAFDRERLHFYRFAPPETLPEARSLIVVAVPRPQTEAVFTWQGRPWPLVLPPTYTAYGKVMEETADLVADLLRPAGYSVAPTALPLKLLAVRSGLGAYGRNNICYVPGMGSFLQLVAVYSDLPCTEDEWQEARMLERCQHCSACLRHCPSGAISSERFLLHAERCLSFHNEKAGDIPFADWIDPAWHNCLQGCMRCQEVCPEDRDFWGWTGVREEFSGEETALLLRGVPREGLPAETVAKLERLDILGDIALLPRNLGVFFGRSVA